MSKESKKFEPGMLDRLMVPFLLLLLTLGLSVLMIVVVLSLFRVFP